MSFNFPNSPTEGTTFTPVGGYQYVFTSGVWRVIESPQVRATAETRNRVVNGAMQVSQENGNTAGAAAGYYAADQWFHNFNCTGTFTAQRVQVVTPNGSKDRFRMTVTVAHAAMAAGEIFYLGTALEGIRVADFRYGLASAKQSVLRFGFKAPAGTYSVQFLNNATNRCYLANFTISAGQANIDTEQVFVIPGDVTGTWLTDTGKGILLNITLAAGTTFQGVLGWQAGGLYATSATSNGLATAGNTFELFDVGLYLDADATGLAPKWQMPDEAQELAACMRYYWKWSSSAAAGTPVGTGYYFSTTGCLAPFYFPVPMRTTVAITSSAASTFNGASPGTAIAFDVLTSFNARMNLTTSATTVNLPVVVGAGGTNAFMSVSARM